MRNLSGAVAGAQTLNQRVLGQYPLAQSLRRLLHRIVLERDSAVAIAHSHELISTAALLLGAVGALALSLLTNRTKQQRLSLAHVLLLLMFVLLERIIVLVFSSYAVLLAATRHNWTI